MNHVVYTAGYGGRCPAGFVALLQSAGVRTVADVRLRPDRASMGSYVRVKTDDKGIAALLGKHGIAYRSLPELGNPFLDDAFSADWQPRYEALLAAASPLLMVRLQALLADDAWEKVCLLCAEKDPKACHRSQIARLLERRGSSVVHLV